MRLKTLIFALLLSLFSITTMAGIAYAHGQGHSSKPVNQATAKKNATLIVGMLAQRDRLDKSWMRVSASSVEKKTFKGNSEWVAVFVNNEITDPAERTLYLFLTLGGEYVGNNFTGRSPTYFPMN